MRNKISTKPENDVVFAPVEVEEIDRNSAMKILVSIASLLGQMRSEEELPVIA